MSSSNPANDDFILIKLYSKSSKALIPTTIPPGASNANLDLVPSAIQIRFTVSQAHEVLAFRSALTARLPKTTCPTKASSLSARTGTCHNYRETRLGINPAPQQQIAGPQHKAKVKRHAKMSGSVEGASGTETHRHRQPTRVGELPAPCDHHISRASQPSRAAPSELTTLLKSGCPLALLLRSNRRQ